MRPSRRTHIATSLLAIAQLGASVADAQTAVTVPARTAWFDTGVDVVAGQRLSITATGQWSNGGTNPQTVSADGWATISVPTLLAPRLPLGALVGRIGRRAFLVGAHYQGRLAVGGRLFLSMNDTRDGFADNQGSLQVAISVLPSIPVVAGGEWTTPPVFVGGAQFTAFAGWVLGGGRIQLSQTGAGLERSIDGRPTMSYIEFGSYLQKAGIPDFAIPLPTLEYSYDQFVNTGGSVSLVQDLAWHKLVFIDRFRYLLNNIHADFDRDLTVRLGEAEVLIDVRLQAPDPALRAEGNGYTAVLFIPIPLGWQDGLWPDISIKGMTATLHLVPVVEDGKLHLEDPKVDVTLGEFSAGVVESFVTDMKALITDKFQKSLQAQLRKPSVKGPLETALTSLFLAGKPNADIAVINIDANGVEVIFRR